MRKKQIGLAGLGGLVYSTNPEAMQVPEAEPVTTPQASEQLLTVVIDKKRRAGKTVTLITGFIGTAEDLIDLSKQLKTKCGVGGSAKDNEIILQGDYKNKVAEYLKEWGYNVKMK